MTVLLVRAVELMRAGVKKRQIRIAKSQGRELLGSLSQLLTLPELGLSVEQKRVAAAWVRVCFPVY